MDHGQRTEHPFEPLYDSRSTILILGSFPSVKSREQQFYYGHPQNRFWKVISAIFGEKLPVSVAEKKKLLLNHGIALWDSIGSCVVEGSSDASIRDVQANDPGMILDSCPIEKICCNGHKSYEAYQRFILPKTGRNAICLPSTSPANARWSLEKLTEAWAAAITGSEYGGGGGTEA